MEKKNLKKIAAEKAVEEIKPGMVVGLGTGSTFQFALERIAEKIKSGELYNIVCIPSSDRTEAEAKRLGIPLTNFSEEFRTKNEEFRTKSVERRVKNEEQNLNNSTLYTLHSSLVSHHSTLIIDVGIDGADEVTVSHPEHGEGSINVIKGGGGALLKEKILAQATKSFFVIVDESKISKHLGEKFFVPIEVIKFAASVEEKFIQSLGAKTSLRKNANGENYITDEGNYIIDATFGPIKNVEELARKLEQRAGIVEHGLFVGMVKKVFCAMSNGEVKEIVLSM